MAFFRNVTWQGPCNGVGCEVKRSVAKASLQRPCRDHIQTPHDMSSFCCKQLGGTYFKYSTTPEWEKENMLLKDRFTTAKTIASTHNLHSFTPISEKNDCQEVF